MLRVDEVRKLSEDLFISGHHNFEFYNILKKTYEAKEWEKIVEELIQNIKDKSQQRYERRVIADIFVKENYFDRFLALIQKQEYNLLLIESYSKYLKNDFPKEVLKI